MIPFYYAPFIFEKKPTLKTIIRFKELDTQSKREVLIFKQLKERGFNLGLPLASFSYYSAIWLLHYDSIMMLAELKTVEGDEDEYLFYYCMGKAGLIIVFNELYDYGTVIEATENVTGKKVIEVWGLQPDSYYDKNALEEARSLLLTKYGANLLFSV